ncbi:MAG: sulfatase-like hydrolase/transferase, partial [Spirochaetia bacterium]|nr:sulfatase-like hydrolase/transferase [Spirochaetia bacterium]
FFLHIAYNAPHFPIQAPAEDLKYYTEKGSYTQAVSTLYAMIERMDKGIGRILDEIKKQGLENNTIVVFTSDNGPDFGGEGEDSLKRYNCNYRGAKTLVYEGGIRVPLIIQWPEALGSGITCDEIVHMTDWYSTLLSVCGVSVPNENEIDGENIFPLLQGNKESRSGRKIFWQWNRFTPFVESNAAVRDGSWKLVQPEVNSVMPSNDPQSIVDMDVDAKYTKQGDTVCEPEKIPIRTRPKPAAPLLFNLESDPEEKFDVSSTHQQRTQRMMNELIDWFSHVESDRQRPLGEKLIHSYRHIEG